MFDHPVILEGKVVRLEPLQKKHINSLMHIAQESPDDFRYTSTPLNEAQQASYFGLAFQTRTEGSAYPWVMIDLKNNKIAGTTRLYDTHWTYRQCKLGYTWFEKRLFGTAFNVESKFLILNYVFEVLRLIRVQMNSDSRNARSQKAIKALGAIYEGTLRSSQVNKDGFVRDNAVFSMIDKDWLNVKGSLAKRVAKKLVQ